MNPSPDPILDSLNPMQAKAVQVIDGPLLILAGAGSGKTKCLTHRIAYMMSNGIPGQNVLAVTFTNKAAAEMKHRVEQLLKALPIAQMGYKMPAMGTFHAICVRILRAQIHSLENGLTKNFVIFNSDDQRSLVKSILKDLGYTEKEFAPRAVHSHISSAKNHLQSADEYMQTAESNRFTKCVYAVMKRYNQKLLQHNAMDFDDLILHTVRLFEHNPNVLETHRKRWPYLMVDEYQDTNFAQYRLIRLLADGHKNLCVIGDDHQSIYRFRGADYTNILNFEADFPTAVTIKLEQNYRSTPQILACANSVIGHNTTGRKKRLWTETPEGDPVEVHNALHERDEADRIAREAKRYTDNGGSLADCVVLYRMNAQSRAIEEALMRHQLPYQIVGGTRFFDRKEIRDVLAYLRLLWNARDDVAFLRVVNVPKRQIGPKTIDVLKRYSNEYTMSLLEILAMVKDISEIPARKQATLTGFYNDLKTLTQGVGTKPISLILEGILEKTGYLKFLDDGTPEGQSRVQNVRELFTVAARYDTADAPLASFLEGVALMSDLDNTDTTGENLTLMTMHGSKGLEWKQVFLPGWEEGIFPGNKAHMDSDSMEEERRLAYVGITRAREKAFIYYCKTRTIYGRTEYAAPSKFIGELDPKSVHMAEPEHLQPSSTSSYSGKRSMLGQAENTSGYSIGDGVTHAAWGDGTVIMVDGDVLSIAFTGRGIKKLVASIAPITKRG